MSRRNWLSRSAGLLGALAALSLLGACSSAPRQPDPTPLQPVPPILHVATAWTAQVGDVPATFQLATASGRVFVASRDGEVSCLQASDGKLLWRTHIAGGISAAVGSDGSFTAVVDDANRVVSLGPQGQVLWRYQLPASVLTPPAVFGGIVVVQGADQHVWAFDAASGAMRWNDEFRTPALLLQKGAGMVLSDGAIVLGDATGHLRLLRLSDGSAVWEATLARPRGTTEVERLVSITGAPSLAHGVVCARAYQSAVACVQMADAHLMWSARANGDTAPAQNGSELVATQADGVIQAYAVSDGKPLWHNDQLRWRRLSAPLLIGRTVAVGDLQGYVSFLDASDGRIIGRASTDGSPIAVPPVLAGNTLVVVSAKGGVYGFVPR